MGAMTDREVREVIGAYMAIRGPSEMGRALAAEPRLRSPAFHEILMLRYLKVRHDDGASEQFRAFESRYLDFFGALLQEWHHAAVAGAERDPAPAAAPATSPEDRVRGLVDAARSRHELGLAAIAALDVLGVLDATLPAGAARQGPLIVDPARPFAVLEDLPEPDDPATRARCRRLAERAHTAAADLPARRRAVSSVLRCRRAGSPDLVTVVHRNYLDASDDPELLAHLDAFNPHWAQDPADALVPVELVAADAPLDDDVLLAAHTVLVPVPEVRLCLPPPLLVRDVARDRVLQVHVDRLESSCEAAVGAPARTTPKAYHMCYDRAELREHLRLSLEAAAGPRGVGALVGEHLLEEYHRKVTRGELALHEAVARIRAMAQADPEMPLPPYIPPSPVGGDPWLQLVSASLFEAVLESRPGLLPAKIAAAMSAAAAYRLLGDEGQAAAAQQRAARHLDEAERRGEATDDARAAVWAGAGDVHHDRGEEDAAIAAWREALAAYRGAAASSERRLNALVVQQKLGLALRGAARLTEAKRVFDDLAADARTLRVALGAAGGGDADDEYATFIAHNAAYAESGAVSNVGSLHAAVLELLQPLASADRGPTVAELAGASRDPRRAAVLEAVGRFLAHGGVTGDTRVDARLLDRVGDEAIAHFERALALAESVSGHDFAAIQATAAAEVLLQLGRDPVAALRQAERAGALADLGVRRDTRADVERARASALAAVGRPADAVAALERAIDDQLRMRVAAGTEQIRRHADVRLRADFSRLADLLAAAGRARDAIENAETIKSNLLAVEILRGAPRITELADAPEAARLRERMTERQEALQALASDAMTDDRAIAERVGELEREIEALRDRLMLDHPRFAEWCRWSNLERVALARLAPLLAGSGVFGLMLGDGGHAWRYGVSGDRTVFEPFSDSDARLRRLVDAVSRLHAGLAGDAYTLDEARAAFRTLARAFAPMTSGLLAGGAEQLLICADGPFHAVPWALLPVDGEPLIEHAAIHHVYGLGVAAAMLDRDPVPPGEGALLVVDPLEGTARGLAGAHDEADAVRRTLGEGACRTLVGADATIEALAGASPGRRVVHLACHGRFGGLADAAGQLDLAPGGEPTTASGHLTPQAITERIDLRSAALVNLAACEVGLVRPELETEIDGIGRACLAAGAHSVLASLWPLRDRAAAVFSGRFYEHLQRLDRPALALQATQRACLRGELGEAMARPANWAGYVCVGIPHTGPTDRKEAP